MGRDRDLLLGVMGAGSRYFEIVNDSLESALFLGRISAIQRKKCRSYYRRGSGGPGPWGERGGEGFANQGPRIDVHISLCKRALLLPRLSLYTGTARVGTCCMVSALCCDASSQHNHMRRSASACINCMLSLLNRMHRVWRIRAGNELWIRHGASEIRYIWYSNLDSILNTKYFRSLR